MPDIQAVISDLDDTLLTEDHKMTLRTQQTLQRLLRQNIKVILASGRSAASMRATVKQVGTPYPYIAYNGAQILEAETGEILMADEIPLALAKEVLAWMESRDVYVQYYHGDSWYCKEHNEITADYAKSTGVQGTAVGKLSDYITTDTPKLLGVDTPERIQALIAEAKEAFDGLLNITTSKPYFIEIMSPTASKGNAVRRLAERIGLSPETTICAGDSLNDLSMLKWSFFPVTVANGRDENKRIAWRIAGDGHQDGLAILLDEIIPEV